MADLKIVNRLDKEYWSAFVYNHPLGNIYQTPEMYEVYSHTCGYKPSVWAAVDSDGQIYALHIPVRITLRGGVLHYFTTRNVNFGSILAQENGAGRDALSLLFQKYNHQVSPASLFTELRHVSDSSEFQDILKSQGYNYDSHLNYFVNLDRDPYDILQSFSRTTRRDIRSNIRKGRVVIKEITDPSMLLLFYEMVKKTYTHARIPLADISLFEAAYKVLVPKNMARFSIAYVDGVPAAASSALLYKSVMYGWYMGVDRSYRPFYPSEFIIWDMVKWGTEHGYKVLDFGGAGDPDEESGVRDFKLKFRGDLVEFGRNTCIHAPVRMKLAENTYNFGRKVIESFRGVKGKLNNN